MNEKKKQIEELEKSLTNMLDKMDHFSKVVDRVPETQRFATELIGRVSVHQAMCHYLELHRAVFGEESSNG